MLVSPNPLTIANDCLAYTHDSTRFLRYDEEYLKSMPRMRIWEGNIEENESNPTVEWREIEKSKENMDSRYLRINPICFRLRNNIYIVSSVVHEPYIISNF